MESIALAKAENNSRDLELARRCAGGDERALREIFDSHEPRLRKLAYRNLGSREDAEELVAATFLKFWRSARRFRGDCTLKSYLTRIALNLCRDRSRVSNRGPVITSDVRHPTSDIEPPLMEQIRVGLLRLDPDDRALLSLYYLEEWDYDEIGESLGISYDVLRTRLVRARKRLRQIVEEEVD